MDAYYLRKLFNILPIVESIAGPRYTGDFGTTCADVLEGCLALAERLTGVCIKNH